MTKLIEPQVEAASDHTSAGWHPAFEAIESLRWWDGDQWTEQRFSEPPQGVSARLRVTVSSHQGVPLWSLVLPTIVWALSARYTSWHENACRVWSRRNDLTVTHVANQGKSWRHSTLRMAPRLLSNPQRGELTGRLVLLGASVADRLTAEQRKWFTELVDVSEYGLGLDMIAAWLSKDELPISDAELGYAAELATVMGSYDRVMSQLLRCPPHA